MSDREALYKRFGLLSIPLYYGKLAVELWRSDYAQLATSAIGTVVVGLTLYKFALFLWSYIRPSTLQRYCHSETGSWALVTGSNDGIGKAFADELLDRGFNVLLHGRNPEKLERTRKALASKYPRRTLDVVVADASRYDQPERTVADKVKQLPGRLTVLVNNVGGANTTPIYEPLSNMTTENIDATINVNARFPTHVTSLLMPELIKNKPALILNCGSGAGILGAPYIVTYASTKAFIHTFTKALAGEILCDGLQKDIEVMEVMINNTRSQGNTSELPLFTVNASDVVRGVFGKVGSGEVMEYGSWRHEVQSAVMGLLGEVNLRKFMAGEMRRRRTEEQEQLKSQ